MKRSLLLAALLGALSTAHAQEVPMDDILVPQARVPADGLITGGQPGADAWALLARRGVATVINLRPDAELDGRDEAAEVRAAGMDYHQIPVEGAGGLSLEKARRLRGLLAQARGPVLVHCASGNRVGALLALAAADEGLPLEQALQRGRAAGMGSTEGRVRELLGAPPAAP